jgi:hypothetical protein
MSHWNNQAWFPPGPGYAYPAPGYQGWQHPGAQPARPPAWHEPKADVHFSRKQRPLTSLTYTSKFIIPSYPPKTLLVDRFRTRKCPNLHPILSADTTNVRIDLRVPPTSDDIQLPAYYVYRHAPATEDYALHIRLVSKDFPWSIEVNSKYNEPVTCEGIWASLYALLQEPVADSEWGMVVADKERAKKIEKAAKKRQETDKNKQLKRIDFLADSYIFKGLEKDDEFMKRRTVFFKEECPETYIMKMTTS